MISDCHSFTDHKKTVKICFSSLKSFYTNLTKEIHLTTTIIKFIFVNLQKI